MVGTEKQWEKFDRDWLKVLNAEDIPYFHAVECERGSGNFYGLDVMKRGKIVENLVRVIRDGSLQPYTYGIVIPHFNEMSLEFKTHYTNGHPDIPYYLCLAQTFMKVSHAADNLPVGEKVLFLFEKQDEFEDEARRLFEEFKGNPKWPNSGRLRDCHFIQKEDVADYPGLQAADLIAYETYRQLDNKHFQPNVRGEWKIRIAIDVLRRKLGEYARYFDERIMPRMEQERLEWLEHPRWDDIERVRDGKTSPVSRASKRLKD